MRLSSPPVPGPPMLIYSMPSAPKASRDTSIHIVCDEYVADVSDTLAVPGAAHDGVAGDHAFAVIGTDAAAHRLVVRDVDPPVGGELRMECDVHQTGHRSSGVDARDTRDRRRLEDAVSNDAQPARLLG